MQTRFAPPERAPKEDVLAVSRRLRSEILLPWFDALPLSVLVINQHRQIIFCNEVFRGLASDGEHNDLVGLRPGEALNCIHAERELAGCGCSEFCRVCGAANALLKGLGGETDCQNCHITRDINGAQVQLDIQVFARPIEFQGERFLLFSAVDIGHEERLGYLKRQFFHDLINNAGGIAQLADLLTMDGAYLEYSSLFMDCARRILSDVVYHRDLSMAEEGRLEIERQEFPAEPFLSSVIASVCKAHGLPATVVELHSHCGVIDSDRRVLGHVLRNLLDNALEAAPQSGDASIRASLRCERLGKHSFLSVTNPGVIPDSIRKQLFKRYVSTKGDNRGLGLHVAKMLTEQHLGGELTLHAEDDMVSVSVKI